MVFSSFVFLFQFLPVFLCLYFLMPDKLKNMIILTGSLIFYFYGIKDYPAYIFLIIFSVIINYGAARFINQAKKTSWQKFWMLLGMLYNIGSLFIFKYLNFLCDNINQILRAAGSAERLPYANLILPIGISFYTFQISSYLIDVYRRKFPAEPSFITLGTYLCLFPQLIAGPIVTFSDIREQLHNRTHSLQKLEDGLREFTIGLSIKVLIANRVGIIWTQAAAIGYESISTPMAWLALAAFSLQIYFDFYGYSLMAKGLGMIMGFDFPDNFKTPYLSLTVSEFWRRWHITLGSWFREYVYIPLGGNRKAYFRNLFIVWLLTGLWHGASWNFVLWGLFSFLLILCENKSYGKILNSKPVLGHLYMTIFILFSWLLFAIPDLTQLGIYFTRMLPFLSQSNSTVFQGDFIKHFNDCALPLLAGLFCCCNLPRTIYEKHKYELPVTLVLVLLFWACVYSMYLGLDDPFLYYQF